MPIWNIDRVPITVIHGVNDERCPIEISQWLFHSLPESHTDKYFVVEKTAHYDYGTITDNAFVDKMQMIIRSGNIETGSLIQNVSALFLLWTITFL